MSFLIVATTTGIRLSAWSIMLIRWAKTFAHFVHCGFSDSDCDKTYRFRPVSLFEDLREFCNWVSLCSFQNLVNMKFSCCCTDQLSSSSSSSLLNVVTCQILMRVVNVERRKGRSEFSINWSMKEPGSRRCCDVNEEQEEYLEQDNRYLAAALRSEWS